MYKCTYNLIMKVEWDSMKAAANVVKHKIDFADAATVLVDDLSVSIRDDTSGEEPFVTVGMDALGRVTGRRLHLARGLHPNHISQKGHPE